MSGGEGDELRVANGEGPWRATFRGDRLVGLEVWREDGGDPKGWTHLMIVTERERRRRGADG